MSIEKEQFQAPVFEGSEAIVAPQIGEAVVGLSAKMNILDVTVAPLSLGLSSSEAMPDSISNSSDGGSCGHCSSGSVQTL